MTTTERGCEYRWCREEIPHDDADESLGHQHVSGVRRVVADDDAVEVRVATYPDGHPDGPTPVLLELTMTLLVAPGVHEDTMALLTAAETDELIASLVAARPDISAPIGFYVLGCVGIAHCVPETAVERAVETNGGWLLTLREDQIADSVCLSCRQRDSVWRYVAYQNPEPGDSTLRRKSRDSHDSRSTRSRAPD